MKKTIQNCEEYYWQRWIDYNPDLEDGEDFEQMLDHQPYYIITSHARVFSVHEKNGKGIELKQYTKESKNARATSRSDSKNQGAVSLVCKDGKSKLIRVAKLVQHYFPISECNPCRSDRTECHHRESYDPEKGRLNNYAENLQTVDSRIHKQILTPIQNSELDENGQMLLKNEKKVFESMVELSGGQDVAYISTFDEEGAHKATFGRVLSDDESNALLQDSRVQRVLREADAAYKSVVIQAAIAYAEKRPDDVRCSRKGISVRDIDTSIKEGKKLRELLEEKLNG